LPQVAPGHPDFEGVARELRFKLREEILRQAIEEAARELRPYDAEAFRSRNVDRVARQPDTKEDGKARTEADDIASLGGDSCSNSSLTFALRLWALLHSPNRKFPVINMDI
jgi:crotonobetainyl-CoA:carnitine CoA-transferase CaiB-like acyl-CoA transferase